MYKKCTDEQTERYVLQKMIYLKTYIAYAITIDVHVKINLSIFVLHVLLQPVPFPYCYLLCDGVSAGNDSICVLYMTIL